MIDRLLERESEVAQIGELIAGATHGGGGVVLVEGPPGIGKTSLLQRAAVLAGERGCAVASARGSELERDFAFGLVRQLYEPLLAGLDRRQRETVLTGAAGLAVPVLAPPQTGGDDPGTEASHAALHGLHWLTANLAAHGPLALIVDDAHWGDAPSLRFLAYLANRIDELPAALVIGARPSEPGADLELLDQVAAGATTRVLRPASLSAEAVAALIPSVLGDDAEPPFAAACAQATGGNPLLLRELLVTLAAEGVAPVAARAAGLREAAPRSVARHVARRLRRLPPEATALAQAAAVLGPAAPPAAAELAGLDRDSASAAAVALADADILDATTLDFVHPVVRAAVYANLSARQRADAHREAARILAGHDVAEDAVALHLLPAEPSGDEWVVGVLRRVARAAHVRGAPDVAATHLRRALAEPAPAADRVNLLIELGTAEVAAAEHTGLDRLREALERAEDPRARGAIALRLGRSLFTRIETAEAARVLQRGLDELGGADRALRRSIEAQLLAVRVANPTLQSRELEARLTALYLARGRLSDPVVLAALATATAIAIPPASQGADLAERALAAGLSFADDQGVFAIAAGTLTIAGRLERARAVWDGAVAGARRRGSLSAFGMASSMRMHVHLRLGALAAAEDDIREVQRFAEHVPPPGAPSLLAAHAEVLVERGEIDRATALVDGLDLHDGSVDPGVSAYVLAQVARVRISQNRVEEGIVHLRECGRRLTAWGTRNPAVVPWRCALALALATRGEREEAVALLDEETRLARGFGVERELGVALRAAGLVQGGPEGIELLREAVAELEDSPARLEHARALTDLGAALRRGGRRAIARGPLREGLELAQRCGATQLARRAHAELIATGARPRRFVLTGVDALTASERRVAEMAVQGLTNREIAEALFVTEKTVEAHMAHTFRKLDIASRSQLPAVLGAQAAASAGAGSAGTYSGGAMSR